MYLLGQAVAPPGALRPQLLGPDSGVSAGNGRMGAEAVRSPFFVPSPEAGGLPLFCGACPG